MKTGNESDKVSINSGFSEGITHEIIKIERHYPKHVQEILSVRGLETAFSTESDNISAFPRFLSTGI